MLAAYLGTTNFSDALTSQQMITLAVVSMFYIPCVATISVLWKEYGWKKAMAICVLEILFAIVLGRTCKKNTGFCFLGIYLFIWSFAFHVETKGY